jgi:hypothetical protein
LAGAAKVAGPVTVVLTGIDVYKDFQKYEGEERWYAATLTVAGTGASIVVAAGITAAGAPVIVVVGAGALAEAGINLGVNWLKDQLFD